MMTQEELTAELKAIDKEMEAKKLALYKKHANANSTVVVDDIVTDHIGSIKVEKIGVYVDRIRGEITSSCKYFGTELKKDLTPKKNGDKRTVFQSNLIKKV